MSRATDDREALEDELVTAAKRPLRNFYKQAGGKDERDYPTLARVVKNVVGEQRWRARPNQSLLDVMWDAIQTLPEQLSVRAGRKAELPVPSRGKFERDIAAMLYGYKEDELPPRFHTGGRAVEVRTYDEDYRPAAIKMAGVEYASTTTQNRVLRFIREDLADVLLVLEQKAIKQRELALAAPATDQNTSRVSPAADPDLIVRQQYIMKVAGQVVHEDKRHCNCVCIWGEPGTGKTFLADQVAHALNFEPVTRLRAGNPAVFQDDLSAFFITEGIEPGNWNESDRRACFKHRLSKSSAGRLKTRIVIIDNVDDETLLDQLVPPDPRVPTFITMRHRPLDQSQNPLPIKHVELGDFSEAEACTFIRRRISGPDTDVRALAKVLGCRPLALDHAIRFIRKAPDITLREIVKALTVDLQSNLVLVTPPEQREQNLIQLYKLILASLADDQSALDVLRAFLAIAGKSGIEHRGSVLLFMLHHPRQPHNRLYYHAGLETLAWLGLLREDADPRDAENVLLVMHPLTYRILRDLEAPEIFPIEADYYDVLENLEIDEHEPRKELHRAGAMAKLRAWEGLVGRHVAPPGYVYFGIIDRETWIAIREAPDQRGVMQQYTVRYEVYPDKVYKLDYRDGKRSPLKSAEARQLHNLITEFYQAAMPELKRLQDSDDADGGEPGS